jgi:CubicO group peptidase (beta-lactamase class C family)
VTYSDLGFVLLMAIVEACTGEPFEQFVAREVFVPFGMYGAAFAPTAGAPRNGAAPTEADERRGGIVRGYVHDENAYAMGGISGHAGLFATAQDVLAYGAGLLGGGRGVLPRDLLATATAPAGLVPGDGSRGLGYQLLQSGTWAGTTVSPGAFGHTGFTGTSLVCDPATDTVVVLLTNRVHPTRVNNKIQMVRRAVHDAVRAAVR